MKCKLLILFALLTCSTNVLTAQADKWTGVWRTTAKPYAAGSTITMELNIGEPLQGMLYPATILLKYGAFTGRYELLLARKTDGQLGIGRNKYPLQETPYKLGIWMWYLNGTLDYQDGKISLHRMWIDKFDIWMHGLYSEDEIFVSSKVELRDFLYRKNMTLTKTGNAPLADSSVQRILYPEKNKVYFGIYHSIVSKDSLLAMNIADQDQYDKDTVTLLHNKKAIFTREQINDHNRSFSERLDTGKNIFIFFADNYGGLPPNTGLLRTTIDGKVHDFDFSERANAYATFLVADIYHAPATGRDTISHNVTNASDTMTSNVIKRETVPVATIPVNTADIVLELRDTKVQDGDSISLSLNGQWVARGFPVKTVVQEIRIHLQPGENILLFTADNLGAIPPNTAELRIRYGRKTRTFNLSTDMRRNNEIKLLLE
ncbi:hypothetical protein ACTJJ0_25635 [Chitinophaga sp. 22321]|uniref:Uncharacterized protein n=1 Tax=Chitinophaga hostae TaxID=2831022 RepID=A0ABS5J5T4_9BACT|nr:hypothetical protein [Chitinophaga hostae]MBS0030430.1 hypothetical protein [Chitinophaga hostae]